MWACTIYQTSLKTYTSKSLLPVFVKIIVRTFQPLVMSANAWNNLDVSNIMLNTEYDYQILVTNYISEDKNFIVEYFFYGCRSVSAAQETFMCTLTNLISLFESCV
jgi:hypothetical protein